MNRELIMIWEELSLVRVEKNDQELIYKIKNTYDIQKYLWFIKDYTKEDIELYYEKRIKWNNNFFSIMHNINKNIIWFVWLKSYSKYNKNGSFVIYLDNCFVWQWFWYKSMQLFMKYCFWVLKLHKLKLSVYDNNINAIKLYEKLWFRKSGLLKEEILIEWRYIDKIYMEILKQDFTNF